MLGGLLSGLFGMFGGGSPFGGGQQPGGSPFGIFGGGQNPFAAGRPTTPMPAQPTANLPQANPFGGLADTFASLPQSPYNGHVDRMSDRAGYKTRHMRGGGQSNTGGGGSAQGMSLMDSSPEGIAAFNNIMRARGHLRDDGMGPGAPAPQPAPAAGGGAPGPQGPFAGNQMVQNWNPIQRYNFGGRQKGGQDYKHGVATRPKM